MIRVIILMPTLIFQQLFSDFINRISSITFATTERGKRSFGRTGEEVSGYSSKGGCLRTISLVILCFIYSCLPYSLTIWKFTPTFQWSWMKTSWIMSHSGRQVLNEAQLTGDMKWFMPVHRFIQSAQKCVCSIPDSVYTLLIASHI